MEDIKEALACSSEELVDIVDDLNNAIRRNNLSIKGSVEEQREIYTILEEIIHDSFFFSSTWKFQY